MNSPNVSHPFTSYPNTPVNPHPSKDSSLQQFFPIVSESKLPSPSLVGRASLSVKKKMVPAKFETYEEIFQGKRPYATVETFFFKKVSENLPDDEKEVLYSLATEYAEINDHAFFAKAHCLLFGIGTKELPEEGFALLQHEKLKRYPMAFFDLAHCYGSGRGTKEDPKEAFKLYKLLYDQGRHYPLIKTCLATHYLLGHGCYKDISLAFRLAKEAFEEDKISNWVLGLCYLKGKMTVNSVEEGLKHLKNAAKLDPHVFRLMSQYYFKEEGNPKKGFKYLTRGAKAGDLRCQLELAQRLLKDNLKSEAHSWFMKASEQGSKEARTISCQLLKEGPFPLKLNGELIDEKKALKWLQAWADEGHAKAQITLSYYYQMGKGGLSPDLKNSLTWLKKAKEANDQEAASLVDEIASILK